MDQDLVYARIPDRRVTSITVQAAGLSTAQLIAAAVVVGSVTAWQGYPNRLARVVNAWDPALDTNLFWALRIGGIIQEAEGFGWQPFAFAGIGQERKVPPLKIPGGVVVDVLAYCQNFAGGTTGNFYSELELEALQQIYNDRPLRRR